MDTHAEYRYLQAFYELGVKPPTHAEAADIIIRMFGREGEHQEWPPAGCAVREQCERRFPGTIRHQWCRMECLRRLRASDNVMG